jgi:16S rRNA (adenine1518-N6/adenine1519-N6)-dimethyltransferase
MSHAPKKSLGQHWLFDSKSLGAICDEAEVASEDTILEIGPGLGPLTVELTSRAKQVIAVELDERLARELPSRVPAHNLKVVHGDILKFDLTELPPGYKVVANVPYYVTSLIVRMLLEASTPPDLAVILVQKEVAERLAAKAGDMSILAVSAQLYAEVTLGPVITADKFDPPPKVDSQVVVLRRFKQPLFKDIDTKLFFRIVKAGFGEKRKTLRNSLSGGLAITKEESETLLGKAGIDPSTRAEALSLEQWHSLTQAAAGSEGGQRK